MPIAYLDAPQGISIEQKQTMTKEIYDAFHEAFQFPDDVRIFLREWSPETVSQDGQLGAEPIRPMFIMRVPQGVRTDAKRKMVKEINAAVGKAYRLPQFMIFMQEYPLDLVSLDGKMHFHNEERVEAQRKVYSE